MMRDHMGSGGCGEKANKNSMPPTAIHSQPSQEREGRGIGASRVGGGGVVASGYTGAERFRVRSTGCIPMVRSGPGSYGFGERVAGHAGLSDRTSAVDGESGDGA